MHANSQIDPNDTTLAASASVQISALLGHAGPISSEVEEGEEAHVCGTVGATLDAADRHYFGGPSEALIRGIPVAAKMPVVAPVPRQARTKDLIAELNAINAQIHQIMFQVEKAVARLEPSGCAINR